MICIFAIGYEGASYLYLLHRSQKILCRKKTAGREGKLNRGASQILTPQKIGGMPFRTNEEHIEIKRRYLIRGMHDLPSTVLQRFPKFLFIYLLLLIFCTTPRVILNLWYHDIM